MSIWQIIPYGRIIIRTQVPKPIFNPASQLQILSYKTYIIRDI